MGRHSSTREQTDIHHGRPTVAAEASSDGTGTTSGEEAVAPSVDSSNATGATADAATTGHDGATQGWGTAAAIAGGVGLLVATSQLLRSSAFFDGAAATVETATTG